MRTQAFEECMNEISLLGKDNIIAIMCAQALPWRCHCGFKGSVLKLILRTLRGLALIH
jgi:hypothetical protein